MSFSRVEEQLLNKQVAFMQLGLIFAILVLSAAAAPEKPAHVDASAPTASVLDMEPIPRTPERLARGKYLVEGLLQCPACHSETDFSKRPGQLSREQISAAMSSPISNSASSNRIASSRPTSRLIPNMARAHGKTPTSCVPCGRASATTAAPSFPLMPYPYFRNLSAMKTWPR